MKVEELPRFVVLPKVASEMVKEDWEQWGDLLSTLTQREQYVTVAHLCDVHFPDHYEPALNMAYRLIARKQPDIIVVGSDTADFGLISTFSPDPDQNEAIDDELDELRRYWTPHIETIQHAAPKALLVYVDGNHEQRIYRHIAENAPKLRRVVERAWSDLVRQQGRVLWLGRRQHVDIGHLVVQHGDRSNEHIAKSLLDDLSYQASTMAGHVHRMNRYDRTGYKYPVSSITSGCLCNLNPHYMKGKKNRRPWQHGTAFATVNMKGTDVFFDNIEFRQIDGRMIAMADGQVVEQSLDKVA